MANKQKKKICNRNWLVELWRVRINQRGILKYIGTSSRN